jgi:hypothetical protein
MEDNAVAQLLARMASIKKLAYRCKLVPALIPAISVAALNVVIASNEDIRV